MARRKYNWDRDRLAYLREQGLGTWRIAKIYGCDQSTVRYWLEKFELPTDTKRATSCFDDRLNHLVRTMRAAE